MRDPERVQDSDYEDGRLRRDPYIVSPAKGEDKIQTEERIRQLLTKEEFHRAEFTTFLREMINLLGGQGDHALGHVSTVPEQTIWIPGTEIYYDFGLSKRGGDSLSVRSYSLIHFLSYEFSDLAKLMVMQPFPSSPIEVVYHSPLTGWDRTIQMAPAISDDFLVTDSEVQQICARAFALYELQR